jgi:hypothetical protein
LAIRQQESVRSWIWWSGIGRFPTRLRRSVAIFGGRNLAFGDSFIIVLNTQAFIDRVCAAAVVAGFECQYRPIEYYDVNTHSGETGPFRKPSHFAYQQEFRFALSPGVKTPVRLTLGDLTDITSPIHALSDINTLVTWSIESSREADL